MIKTITLKEPWFGAGTSLGWGTRDTWGFGVNKKLYDEADTLVIKTKYGNYQVDKQTVEAFAGRTAYRRKSAILVVIPREICKQL